jgi:predicted transcriptional regulator
MLKGEQKWLYHGTKIKQRKSSVVATSANVTHTLNSINEGELDNESHGNNVDFERPIGRKAEKAKRKRKEGPSEEAVEFMKKKMESLEDARVQGEEFLRLEKEKFQLQKLDLEEKINMEKRKLHLQELDREERIMTLDTSGMSEFQQQYWIARQKEIVQIHKSRN